MTFRRQPASASRLRSAPVRLRAGWHASPRRDAVMAPAAGIGIRIDAVAVLQ